MAEAVRVQKALADAGLASRRAADALVAAGRVTVNGQPAVTGQRIDPGSDVLAVDGRPVPPAGRRTYLALHKPAGVTSTVSDRHAERTVLDLLPAEVWARGSRLYPVGRLDKDSEGLILLTDDGDWAQRLLHPRYGVEREYAVGLRAPLEAAQARALSEGVELDEGRAALRGLRPATRTETARLVRPSEARAPLVWYRAVLTQGWRRQLRRMFAAVGAPVGRLVRVRIGTLRLDDLPAGSVRELDGAERERLAKTRRAAPGRAKHDASPGRTTLGASPGRATRGRT
jgi:23S rRNA pseudouridine2605 synthase